MSYTNDPADQAGIAAGLVGQILKGVKTAKQLGLNVPTLARPRRGGDRINQRQLIAGLGDAAAWPMMARAQQPKTRVIGYLSSRPRDTGPVRVLFLRGPSKCGYTEGCNIAIEYRWAEAHYDRLPALAAELVQRRVDVIYAGGNGDSARAAKAATAKIPLVFGVGVGPVQYGLVASLKRPGSSLTGYTVLNSDVVAKRADLMHQLVPTSTLVAVLTNPANSVTSRK